MLGVPGSELARLDQAQDALTAALTVGRRRVSPDVIFGPRQGGPELFSTPTPVDRRGLDHGVLENAETEVVDQFGDQNSRPRSSATATPASRDRCSSETTSTVHPRRSATAMRSEAVAGCVAHDRSRVL